MKRLFIGFPIASQCAQQRVENWKQQPELNSNRLIWTLSSNWHVTLVFLGAKSDEYIGIISNIIEEAFDQCLIYSAFLMGVGIFPNRRKPGVLWMGLSPIDPLLDAYARMIRLLEENKFSFDPKPLNPHLTVARIKTIVNRDAILQLVDQHKKDSFGEVPVNRIVLYESVSTPNGVIYIPLYEKRLQVGNH